MLMFLSLSILLPYATMAAPVRISAQQLAPQNEVDVLVYGVMQFSTALHELYSSTAQKLDKIRHRTNIYEEGVQTLHRQVQNAQQKQQETRIILERLKAQDTVLKKEAQRHEEVLQGVFVEQQNLAHRLRALEVMLSFMEKQDFQDQEGKVAALKMKSHTGGK
nr:PREDICTED: uncharacterized protein LOC103277738 [Anolis carolinensis]|eukprot:XP_008101987.1 PREDICTED: uncharacterized protein LOC103277738 [Anolis carolinensis]